MYKPHATCAEYDTVLALECLQNWKSVCGDNSHLELGHARCLLDLDRGGILPACGEEEVLDLLNLLGLQARDAGESGGITSGGESSVGRDRRWKQRQKGGESSTNDTALTIPPTLTLSAASQSMVLSDDTPSAPIKW